MTIPRASAGIERAAYEAALAEVEASEPFSEAERYLLLSTLRQMNPCLSPEIARYEATVQTLASGAPRETPAPAPEIDALLNEYVSCTIAVRLNEGSPFDETDRRRTAQMQSDLADARTALLAAFARGAHREPEATAPAAQILAWGILDREGALHDFKGDRDSAERKAGRLTLNDEEAPVHTLKLGPFRVEPLVSGLRVGAQPTAPAPIAWAVMAGVDRVFQVCLNAADAERYRESYQRGAHSLQFRVVPLVAGVSRGAQPEGTENGR
jgi:hypothetical protein